MDINLILEDVTRGIATNTKIDAWSKIHYDRGVMVQENDDPRRTWQEGNCPLVIVFFEDKKTGGREKHSIFSVLCVVHDNEKPEDISGVVRYGGARRVEELRKMVFAVLRESLPAGVRVDSMSAECDQITRYPFVTEVMEVGLIQAWTTGSDQFE